MDTSFPQSGEMTPIARLELYFSVILKFRWLVILAAGLTALIAVGFSVLSVRLPPEKSPLPNIYTANAVLLVQKESGIGLSTLLGSLGVLPAPSGDTASTSFDYGQIAIKVLHSRPVVDKLIDEFKPPRWNDASSVSRTMARGAFAARSTFAYDRQTGALSISFDDTDPVVARDVTNRMVQLLADWFSSTGGSMKVKEKNKLEEKLAEVKTEIARLDANVRVFQEQYGVLTPALSLKYAQLTLDLEIQRKIYESISQQYEIDKLDLETEPLFQVLELAETPDEKSGPKRDQLCALAIVLAGLASVALSFFLHAFATRVRQPVVRSQVAGKPL